MPEGAPSSWQIVRCSCGSWGEAKGVGDSAWVSRSAVDLRLMQQCMAFGGEFSLMHTFEDVGIGGSADTRDETGAGAKM